MDPITLAALAQAGSSLQEAQEAGFPILSGVLEAVGVDVGQSSADDAAQLEAARKATKAAEEQAERAAQQARVLTYGMLAAGGVALLAVLWRSK